MKDSSGKIIEELHGVCERDRDWAKVTIQRWNNNERERSVSNSVFLEMIKSSRRADDTFGDPILGTPAENVDF